VAVNRLADSQTIGSLLNVWYAGPSSAPKQLPFWRDRPVKRLGTGLPKRAITASAFRLQYSDRLNQPFMFRKMKRHFWNSLASLALCFLISLDGMPQAALAQNAPARIDILVVSGEGATNGLRQRVTQDPAVKIEDDDHRPIAGVPVVFALPVSGTSGEFTNGTKTLTVLTDKAGVATAHGLRTNEIPGKLQIYVTASFHGLRARTLINQNVAAPAGTTAPVREVRAKSGGGKWKWVLLGVAAAGGAGAGFYFGTHSTNSPISIGTGTVVFGSPR